MKKNILVAFVIVIIIFLGLIIWRKDQKLPQNIIQNSQPTDFSDDAVFADGSVPTTWDIAGITDPVGFKKFLLTLQTAVLAHDKNIVVASLDTKKFTKEDALNNYDILFNPKVVNAFQNLNIHQIFRNYQGAMIGNGTVWFEQNNDGTFSILAINNKN